MKYGIVALGYNRVDSLERLLNKLSRCYYGEEKVTLIISLDFSGNIELKKKAEEYQWDYGEKIIKAYESNIGLRKHVLNCGNYMNEYGIDAIAIFEDDTYPSYNFFTYMTKAVDFYKEDDNIAGISLYSHQWNVNAQCVFEPYRTEYDVFFMQYAQSWGQVWIRQRWNEFYEWYLDNEKFKAEDSLPEFVNSWPESSWLKYHIKYCVEKNKFFVYPYVPYATCFSDVGEHTKRKSTLQQVVVQEGTKKIFLFPEYNEGAVAYDVFFERILHGSIAGIKAEEICVDLYQTKKLKKERYILSTQIFDYRVIASFGLQIRPQEANIIETVSGQDIFLYDKEKVEKNKKSRKEQFFCVKEYRNKVAINRKTILDIFLHLFSLK